MLAEMLPKVDFESIEPPKDFEDALKQELPITWLAEMMGKEAHIKPEDFILTALDKRALSDPAIMKAFMNLTMAIATAMLPKEMADMMAAFGGNLF